MNIYIQKACEILKGNIKNVIYIPNDISIFFKGLIKIRRDGRKNGFPIVGLLPLIGNNHEEAGQIDRHYFLQDIYMARKVIKNQPMIHFDIGSRVDGFISHLLSSDIPVTMIDIRPLDKKINGLSFICSDATSLSNIADGSIESLSTLHAVEHFGLGRYGDPMDPNAHLQAMKEIQRVIKKFGYLYFSVPISYRNGVVYNSHRVYRPRCIVKQFDKMKLVRFAYIHDYKLYEYNGRDAYRKLRKNDFNEYDCGLFIFKKIR